MPLRKSQIRESISDACLVSINNENYRVCVKEFTGWVLDFDAIDDNSQKEWASNNSDSDEDEQSIHINDEVEEETVIKPTWAEEMNNLKAKENVIFEKDEEINKDRDQETSNSPYKPTGFEGFRSLTSTFNHGKKKSRANLSNSHFNARGSRSGNCRSTGSLIDAFIFHIEMGSVFGYDMEGSKTDLKKYIDNIGVHGSRSGGLLSIWEPSIFIKANIFSMENLLIVEGEWVFKKMKCYSPQEERKKKDLWNFIRNFISDQPGHYFVFGDFNVVRFSSERIGSLFNHRSAFDFNEFIKDYRFWDVPLGGHAFTRISGNGEKLSRLDRFLLSEDVTNIVPNLMAVSLDRLISDHRPIILMQSNVDFGLTPFNFYNSWLSFLDFDGMVTKVWNQSHGISGPNAMLVFKDKRHLKSNIKLWARKFNASKSEEKVQLSSKIVDIKRDLEAGSGSSSLCSRRKDMLLKLCDIERAESLDAYQKAKIKWGIEADENTKFFHGIVKKKRRGLAINLVMKNGTWFSDPRDIKDIFREFFVEKFKHFEGVDVTRRSDHYKTLSSAQVSLLEHSISEREVYDAIRDCGDPLSPFLFILVMEALHAAVEDAINVGLYRGGQVRSLHIYHLLFANDVLFLGEWSRSNIIGLVSLLQCFHDVSGLKINLHKSTYMVLGLTIMKFPTLLRSLVVLPNNFYLRQFLLGLHGWDQKIPWNSVLASKVKGGLGIGSLEANKEK
ncbi:RNA-directed DNA polymerase, eukaryota, reverse transcriptase zinc-binding domain protein [Tanacetum coccineum]